MTRSSVQLANRLTPTATQVMLDLPLEAERGIARPEQFIGPRRYALMMIVTGLIALLLAAVQHRANLRSLDDMGGGARQLSVAGWVAALVGLMGLLALVAVLVRG